MTEVHPIEAESYRIMRSRIDLSTLPPLTRAVTERIIHLSLIHISEPTRRS